LRAQKSRDPGSAKRFAGDFAKGFAKGFVVRP
jgi:hypothetical protein